jgi:hypothetical protein
LFTMFPTIIYNLITGGNVFTRGFVTAFCIVFLAFAINAGDTTFAVLWAIVSVLQGLAFIAELIDFMDSRKKLARQS